MAQMIRVNLLPEKKKFKMPEIPWGIIAGLILVVFVAYFLYFIETESMEEQKLELENQKKLAEDKKNKKLADKKQKLRQLTDQINTKRRQVSKIMELTGADLISWSSLMSEFSSVIPANEIWLKTLNYDKSGQVTFVGIGIPREKDDSGRKLDKDKEQVFHSVQSFYNSLKSHKYYYPKSTDSSKSQVIFTNVFISSATRGQFQNSTVCNFQITSQLVRKKNLESLRGGDSL